ncbi:hypothetical protein BG011_009685, partial [Mortierella polycephala]
YFTEMILLGKRFLSVNHTTNCVRVDCADNTYYEADIVIGTNGHYSAIQQSIYKDLKEKDMLRIRRGGRDGVYLYGGHDGSTGHAKVLTV